MAEYRRFDAHLADIEEVAKNPVTYMTAVTAARYFAKALDALQADFAPEPSAGDEASSLYYSLVREYLLDAADDIEAFEDDGGSVG